MEVFSSVILYFGAKVFVRCSEVSVVQRCPYGGSIERIQLYSKKFIAAIFSIIVHCACKFSDKKFLLLCLPCKWDI